MKAQFNLSIRRGLTASFHRVRRVHRGYAKPKIMFYSIMYNTLYIINIARNDGISFITSRRIIYQSKRRRKRKASKTKFLNQLISIQNLISVCQINNC